MVIFNHKNVLLNYYYEATIFQIENSANYCMVTVI